MMKIKEMTDLQVCLMFILVYIVLFALVWGLFKLIKWIKNKRKWARATKRGLERFPIGSMWRLTSIDAPNPVFKVSSVWASRYKYEDAYCVRLELVGGEKEYKIRLVEGDPDFKYLERIDTESSQKLN